MGGDVRRIDKKIVHIDNEPSFCDHIMEGVVHELLEGGGGVGKTKEHYSWFKKSFVGDKGDFPLVSILDLDIVISPVNIEFGEDFRSLEFVDKVRDEGEGVCVMYCVLIDVVIVLTGIKTTILLFNKKEGGCLWGV